MRQRRMQSMLYQTDLHGEVFQSSERTFRLIKVVYLFLNLVFDVKIKLLYLKFYHNFLILHRRLFYFNRNAANREVNVVSF